MTQPLSTANWRKYPKSPNFPLIVFLSGLTLLVFFLAAYLLLSDTGKRLLPSLHHHPHPTSNLAPPISNTRAV